MAASTIVPVIAHVDADSVGDDDMMKLAAEAIRCRSKPKLFDTRLLWMAEGTNVHGLGLQARRGRRGGRCVVAGGGEEAVHGARHVG
jgi:hypothetical protein